MVRDVYIYALKYKYNHVVTFYKRLIITLGTIIKKKEKKWTGMQLYFWIISHFLSSIIWLVEHFLTKSHILIIKEGVSYHVILFSEIREWRYIYRCFLKGYKNLFLSEFVVFPYILYLHVSNKLYSHDEQWVSGVYHENKSYFLQ